MCGIVGYVGPRAATPIVVNGLQRLEYRGYDSAGLAVLQNDGIQVRRDAGKLSNLIALLAAQPANNDSPRSRARAFTDGPPRAFLTALLRSAQPQPPR